MPVDVELSFDSKGMLVLLPPGGQPVSGTKRANWVACMYPVPNQRLYQWRDGDAARWQHAVRNAWAHLCPALMVASAMTIKLAAPLSGTQILWLLLPSSAQP